MCDYRDIPGRGTYDKVISCEMIEAVGQENLATYFGAIGSALRIGGKAVLQVGHLLLAAALTLSSIWDQDAQGNMT